MEPVAGGLEKRLDSYVIRNVVSAEESWGKE